MKNWTEKGKQARATRRGTTKKEKEQEDQKGYEEEDWAKTQNNYNNKKNYRKTRKSVFKAR